MLTFDQLNPGDRATVKSLQGLPRDYRQQLLAMGLIPGTDIKIERVAPLGDPVQIKVRGCVLSLRRNEASLIEVERYVDG